MNSLILSLFALLMFVLSIPGTMALRNISAVLLLTTLLIIWYKNKAHPSYLLENKKFREIMLVLFLLSLYLLVHSIFISHEPKWSLGEFKSHWIYPVLYFIIGFLAVSITRIKGFFSKEDLITILFYSLLLHILYIDLSALEDYLRSDLIIRRYGGLSLSPATASYLTNILLVFICAEILQRLLNQKNIVNISNLGLFSSLLLCVLSAIIESSRFGVILFVFISLLAIILFLYKRHFLLKSSFFYAILLISLVSTPLIYSLNIDPRWDKIKNTVEIVFEEENDKYWLNNMSNPLLLSDGSPASSGYLRLSWIINGFDYILKNPIGIGYGRNAFGHAVEMYEDKSEFRGGSSHSSIIDFTIGAGFVGLIFWMFFIYRVVGYAAIKYKKSNNYFSILTLLLVFDFFIRSAVDGNMRDHPFMMFMLLLGISLSFISYGNINKTGKQ